MKEYARRALRRPERIMLVLTALFALAALVLALRPAPALRLASLPEPSAAVQPVDLNTADAALLETLPGIGPELAERIVLDRAQNGPFSAVSDLTRVDGIGEKTAAQLEPIVTVSQPKEENP